MLTFCSENIKLFFVLLLCTLATRTKQHCYDVQMTGIRTTDTPEYRFELFLHANNTLSSITRVLKDVPTPIWHIVLTRYRNDSKIDKGNGNRKTPPKRKAGAGTYDAADQRFVLYNSTHKVCDFMRYVKRVRIFADIPAFLLKTSNMSLACPLLSDTYVMRNIRVPPDTAILQFAYAPNTHFMFTGTVYSQLADKSLHKLCHYDINGTVTKRC